MRAVVASRQQSPARRMGLARAGEGEKTLQPCYQELDRRSYYTKDCWQIATVLLSFLISSRVNLR